MGVYNIHSNRPKRIINYDVILLNKIKLIRLAKSQIREKHELITKRIQT